jgi:ribosome biogenesis GTPase A
MPESTKTVQLPTFIPESLMLAVLNRCDDMKEFMVEIWRNNPQLAKQGGAKVAMLLSAYNLPK